MNRTLGSLTFSIFSAALSAAIVSACSGGNGGSGFGQNPSGGNSGGSSGGTSGGSSGGGMGSDDGGLVGTFGDSSTGPQSDASGQGCSNLQCQVQACPNGGSTTISGKVLDPAGHNPLYGVVTFIPNTQGGQLPLIPLGINSASCSCDALFTGEEPMADSITAADGTFTIANAPVGSNIPLVVQIGKWRKEIIVPTVKACQDNAAGSINLPKNHSDGMYASLPNIAVSTGGADSLECLLTRAGVDEAEFSGDPNTPDARVHVFQGRGGNTTVSPAAPSSPTSLWDSDADLERYDIVLLSCEGSPTTGSNSQTIADYVSAGGRVFGEHFHYQFFANQPQFANTATWMTSGGGIGNSGIDAVVQTTLLSNGQPFPEGIALNTWLGNVGALTSGDLPIPVPRYDALVSGTNVSTAWIVTAPSAPTKSTQYFSWDMPFNAPITDAGTPAYCGRVVFSDLHVSGSAGGGGGAKGEDYTSALGSTVPTGCDSTATLQPDEDALEFILFDLSSCVTPVGLPPKPPPAPEGGTYQ
jgi:hypothetical protein